MADKLSTVALTMIWASSIGAAFVCIQDFIDYRRAIRLNKDLMRLDSAMESRARARARDRARALARARARGGGGSDGVSGGDGSGGNNNLQF